MKRKELTNSKYYIVDKKTLISDIDNLIIKKDYNKAISLIRDFNIDMSTIAKNNYLIEFFNTKEKNKFNLQTRTSKQYMIVCLSLYIFFISLFGLFISMIKSSPTNQIIINMPIYLISAMATTSLLTFIYNFIILKKINYKNKKHIGI